MEYNRTGSYDPEVLKKLHGVQLQLLKDFMETCRKHHLKYFLVYGTAIGAVRHKGFIPWDDDIDVGMLRKDYDRFLEIFPAEMKDRYQLLTPFTDGRYSCTVTHIQKRGTKFVSEVTRNMEYEQGIFMDIFPFDYVAANKGAALFQGAMANFWGKLLFLRGTPEPVINVGGWKGRFLGQACKMVHGFLCLIGIQPRTLYKKFLKTAKKYNNSKKRSEYVTSFEYMGCLKDKVRAKELFPLRKILFEDLEAYIPGNNEEFLGKVYGDFMQIPPKENRVNHMPYMIQFEGEEPIYVGK